MSGWTDTARHQPKDPCGKALAGWPTRWPLRRKYLVGVSGGVDSVVLLRHLWEVGYRQLVVCHLDHGLRGRASREDARWTGRLAEKLGLIFEGAQVAVAEAALASGRSLETEGRFQRHRFFADIARRHRCSALWLGHHADDQAETILMNLCRGSAGLMGMSPETRLQAGEPPRVLTVLRPFLEVEKRELRTQALERRWKFREDATNAVGDVVRNRIRLEVMPLLESIFQRPVAASLGRAAGWTAAVRAWLLESAASWVPMERLSVPELLQMPPPLRDTVLTEWLRAQNIPDVSSSLIRQAVKMLDPATGPARWNLPGGSFLRRSRGWLQVELVPPCRSGGS